MSDPSLDARDDDLPIVDAHHHVWDPDANYIPWLCDEPPIPFRYGDYRSLRRPYMPDDFRRDWGRHRVVKSVYIETEWDPRDPIGETRWIDAVARRHGLPHAVIAQAWLDRADVAEVLAGQAAFPIVRGIRHKPKASPRREDARRGAPGSMDDPRWRDGYALLARNGLHFELQTPWWHLEAAAALARDFPATMIVLNHTGLPSDRSAEGLAGWRAAMTTLAREPNVAVKISGIGLPGRPWTPENNGPIIRDTIAIFGAARCMFASNFPVDGLAGSFDDIFSGFKRVTSDLPPETRRALFHDNAVRIYRLG
ncbi:MAG: amidohydrolase family protein [Alphaproteobacteria bacterium]|nr:amidohydrolase family protein [Alphaproteobacteria bacterium]